LFVSRRDRWVAPQEDGGILIDPPIERVEELLETNRRRFAASNIHIAGKPLQEHRFDVRSGLQSGQPVVATGHQPDFVHPGVWLKNFAINGIARRVGLRSVNVVIDTDTRKSTSLPMPTFGPEPGNVALRHAAYDEWNGVERFFARVKNPSQFLSFAESSRETLKDWPFEPLLPHFWQHVRALWTEHCEKWANDPYSPQPRLEDCTHFARLQFEEAWGCCNGDIYASGLPMDDFFLHVLCDMPRFRAVYNDCLLSYRHRHRLRNAGHPVADLTEDDGFLEVPFWFVSRGQRHRGFVRQVGRELEVRVAGITLREEPRNLLIRVQYELQCLLQPRALMSTMFIRLFLADLFIHGIGGAKYDEVTDDIIRRYFGIEPPEYMVVSGTLRLPFPTFPATPAERRRLGRKRRDLQWHPEQFLDHANDLVEQKQRWQEREPMTADERRARYRELLHLTEALRPMVADQAAVVDAQLARCDQELAANEILTRRDYPFVLYPESKLRPFLTQLL
jgi:hypothetical protein